MLKHVVYENVISGSSMVGFPNLIADSEWDMGGIEPGQLGWHFNHWDTRNDKHVVHENVVGGSSIIWGFPLVIADSERDMPGIKPGPLGWYTSALTTGLQEVRV